MKAKTLWAWTIGLILITFALGCVSVFGWTPDAPTKSPADLADAPLPQPPTLMVELGASGHTAWLRAVDHEAGVVCWLARNHVYGGSAVAIDCLPLDQTLLLEAAP